VKDLIALFNAGKYSELEKRSLIETKKAAHNGFAWKALAVAQKKLGKNALHAAQQAAKLLPADHETHNTLGLARKSVADFSGAAQSYRQAIALKPSYVEAYNNLGHVQLLLGDLRGGIATYQQALAIAPDFLDCRSNLLYAYTLLPDAAREEAFACAKTYGEIVARKYAAFSSRRPRQERLRIGFVSGDFRTHPVAYFILGLLAELRALDQCDLIAYSNNPIADGLTAKLRSAFHEWREIFGLSDMAAANAIREDGIDVLIDLSGHTAHNRLPVFALRPAPVQASWLGFVATTGVKAIDYYIADPWVAPDSEDANFTEKIWRLPETMMCFTVPEFDLPVTALPAMANGYITFGSFNNLAKINLQVIELWAEILRALPTSRLFMNTRQLNDKNAVTKVRTQFAEFGITGERLDLDYVTPREASLAAYNRIDIALDSFPYNGGTTTVEALWMGVPVLTLKGNALVGRLGTSCLANVGLHDWITESKEQYVAKAAKAASDPSALAALRAGLRTRSLESPLFQARRFARNFMDSLTAITGQQELKQK